ncbi:hypothetical protein NL108_000948, partial [Boleophthalmus pectinirostris]
TEIEKAVNPRPEFTTQQVVDLIQRLNGLKANEIASLPSYNDQNFCIKTTGGSKCVLKITNSIDSKNRTIIEVQTEAMSFLKSCGHPVQTALHNLSGQLLSFEELDCGHGCQTYCVKLMVYLPGVPIIECQVSQESLYDVGQLGAMMSRSMQEFKHPNCDVLDGITVKTWNIGHIHLVEQCLSVMDGDPFQGIIREVIKALKSQVLHKLSSFPTGITHGDFSGQNILVTPVGNGCHKVSGIIDFSDLYRKCYVNEIAVAIAYLMLNNPCPLKVGGAVLAGWESVLPLSEEERECLYLLVLGRLCQSLVYGRHNALQMPENKEYFMVTAKHGIQILTNFWKMGKKEVEQIWFCDAKTISRCMSL